MAYPQPILSHMPRHIKEMIVDSLHTVHKFSLRQCSKEFKSVVDESAITFESLQLGFRRPENVIILERTIMEKQKERNNNSYRNFTNINHSIKLEFHPRPNGFLRKNIKENSEVFVENGDFIEAAVEKLMSIFRNPKVFIHSLCIYLSDRYDEDELCNQRRELIMDKLNESLGALGHRVAVRRLSIYTDLNANNIIRVLPHLQPGTLQTFSINSQKSDLTGNLPVLDLNGIIGMEQWKQATDLLVHDFKLTLDRETTVHFDKLTHRVETVDIEDFDYMIPFFLRQDGWIARSVCCYNLDYASIKQYLSQLPGVEVTELDVITAFKILRDRFECLVTVEQNRIRIINPYKTRPNTYLRHLYR